MPGVPAHIAGDSLDVRKDARPVKQALQCFATGKRRTIGEEIARLLAVGSRGPARGPARSRSVILACKPRSPL